MRITELTIRNFRSIKEMKLSGIENALILVGQNSTGKTAILDAIRAVSGTYQIKKEDYRENYSNIEILVSMAIWEEDLHTLHRKGCVSQYRRYDAWENDFRRKLPSFQNGVLTFEFVANRDGKIRYSDAIRKHNPYLLEILPKIYDINAERSLEHLYESDLSSG